MVLHGAVPFSAGISYLLSGSVHLLKLSISSSTCTKGPCRNTTTSAQQPHDVTNTVGCWYCDVTNSECWYCGVLVL
uniref:Uncharacterized protein n=1 Tax=Salmo trutta TaxID=8032 RepID=A0A674AZ89_SALTR